MLSPTTPSAPVSAEQKLINDVSDALFDYLDTQAPVLVQRVNALVNVPILNEEQEHRYVFEPGVTRLLQEARKLVTEKVGGLA